MRLRDEIRLSVGALLFIQVLAMTAAVALLARMTPAIDRILEENENSIRAVERMLLALAEPPPQDPERARERRLDFERGLAGALGNITEVSEEPALARIEAEYEAALAGDPVALDSVRAQLWQLGDINRQSMHAANERAKRLGTAGAWVLVFLGLLGLVFSIALMRRARIKLIDPVYELGEVLSACAEGDAQRRFRTDGAAREFHGVGEVINSLVDEHFFDRERDWERIARLDRVALLNLLDREASPIFVCDRGGRVAAANRAGLDHLQGGGGKELREQIGRACVGEEPGRFELEHLVDETGWICRLGDHSPASGEAPPSAASGAAASGAAEASEGSA
jgi:HAMP domain-containing protein